MQQRTTTEPWRAVWRGLIAPRISRPALEALADALARDDGRLMQGAHYSEGEGGRWERACPFCYALAAERSLVTAEGLGLAADGFLAVLPAGTGHFFHWVDGTDWQDVRRELEAEVRAHLAAEVGVVPGRTQ
jgi:hypothetical protein